MSEALKSDILAHLVFMAARDKAYAWWAAKHYAKIGECLGWSDLPELLTKRMREKEAA